MKKTNLFVKNRFESDILKIPYTSINTISSGVICSHQNCSYLLCFPYDFHWISICRLINCCNLTSILSHCLFIRLCHFRTNSVLTTSRSIDFQWNQIILKRQVNWNEKKKPVRENIALRSCFHKWQNHNHMQGKLIDGVSTL